MSEDDLIAQLCTVINTSDTALARNLLVYSNWDLQEAILKYFDRNHDSAVQSNQSGHFLSFLNKLFELLKRFGRSIFSFFGPSFDKYFISTYGCTSISFYNDSFIKASNHAKSTSKPLIVYLHYEESENTEEFCKGILCNPNIGDILFGDYVFWAQNVSSNEGRRIKRLCDANNYPHISIFAFENNNLIKIGSIQGRITLTSFTQFARTNLTKVYEGGFGNSKIIKDRMLREKQNRELEEAMKQDQQRLIEKKNKEQLELDENKRNREFVEAFKARVIPQVDYVKLKVRLPDGSSLHENFSKTDSIGYLKEWLSASHLLYKEREGKNLGNFSLQVPYSKNKLDKSSETLEATGLFPNGTILVMLDE